MRLAVLLAVAAMAVSGCTSRLVVESDPAGGVVMWSPTGVDDWRPWPPRAWGEPHDPAPLTPLRDSGRWSDVVWITVDKDGFHRPLPQVAQLYPMRSAHLDFQLIETPEAFAARMRAQGLILYRGEWVRPEEQGLVEFAGSWMTPEEAFAARQRAAGLVEYAGEWMTPAERDSRYATDQRAKGLELFKDRWVSPEVREKEERIDAEVAAIAAAGAEFLEPPRVIGRMDTSDAQVQLVNATSQDVRFLFSGPQSREVVAERYATVTQFHLLPGRYGMAVVPMVSHMAPPTDSIAVRLPQLIETEQQFRPTYTEHPVVEGFKYLLTYTGGEEVGLGELGTYEPRQPELPTTLPQIEVPEVDIPEPQQPQRPQGR